MRLASITVTALGLTALVTSYAFGVRTASGQLLDDAGMRLVSAVLGEQAWMQQVLSLVTVGGLVLTTFGLAMLGALRGRWAAAGAAVGGAAAVSLGAQVLKEVLSRPADLGGMTTNSFPSGHVAALAAVGVALLVVTPRIWRGLVFLLVVAPVVLAAGAATVALGWHRPSDAIGAAALALVVLPIATAVADGRGRPARKDQLLAVGYRTDRRIGA